MNKPFAVVDVETDGLEANRLYLVGVYLPENDEFVCIDIHLDAKYIDKDSAAYIQVQQVLNDYVCIFHNSGFDINVLEKFGWEVKDFQDTMLMSYVWFPGWGLHTDTVAHNLKKGAKKIRSAHSLANWGFHLGAPKLDYGDFDNYSQEMIPYCEQDCRLTWRVFEVLRLEFATDPAAYGIYLNVELPFVRVIQEIEKNGMLLNAEELAEFAEKMAYEAKAIEDEMRNLVPEVLSSSNKVYKRPLEKTEDSWGGTPIYRSKVGKRFIYDEDPCRDEDDHNHYYREIVRFNANSDDHLRYAMTELYNWTPTEFTKSGKPSVSKQVLEELEYPLAQLAVKRSKPQKMASTYGESLLALTDDFGYIHGHLNQVVTLTGRLSSSKPNLQNFPKHGELGDTVRKIFIAPHGYKAFAVDCSGFQMRICAWYLKHLFPEASDAHLMWEDFNTGLGDPHLVAAAAIFGKPKSEVTHEERFVAKKGNFGDIFGVGVAKLASQAGISKSVAKDFLERKRQNFPSVGLAKEAVINAARENKGVFHTLYGRRLVYLDLFSKDKNLKARAERQLFNAVIQGTEADVMKMLCLEMLPIALSYGAKLAAIVHDELFGYVPEDVAEKFIEQANSVFAGDYLPGLKMVGDAALGNNWFECH